jgi:hypothetical protein
VNPGASQSNQPIRQSTNLADARRAMSALAPHLPEPRLSEWMRACGVTLPRYDVLGAPNEVPLMHWPVALLEGLGPYTLRSLPKHWFPAHQQLTQQQNRGVQFLRLHSACLQVETGDEAIPDLVRCDGVVAGLLMLVVRPRSGALRARLLRAAVTHPFGACLAAHGKLIEDERAAVLDRVAKDSRVASALYRHDPEAARSLPERLHASHDLWSATLALNHAKAQCWLQRVVSKAAEDPVAAVTALTLQPQVNQKLQQRWLAGVLNSQPGLAYQAARWTKRTWGSERWLDLRDQLRARATSDLGCAFFHWYRDVEVEASDEALRQEGVEVLWRAELIQANKSFGHALRRRCLLRLNSDAADVEAKLALRWIGRRGRPR